MCCPNFPVVSNSDIRNNTDPETQESLEFLGYELVDELNFDENDQFIDFDDEPNQETCPYGCGNLVNCCRCDDIEECPNGCGHDVSDCRCDPREDNEEFLEIDDRRRYGWSVQYGQWPY
jgi:hypothetical protein